MRKKIITMVLGLMVLSSTSASATGWFSTDGGNESYVSEEGIIPQGFAQIGDKMYYFDSIGNSSFGWVKVDNDWFFFGPGGAMITGWINLEGNRWYYLNQSGVMQTGNVNLNGTWYTFDESGQLI